MTANKSQLFALIITLVITLAALPSPGLAQAQTTTEGPGGVVAGDGSTIYCRPPQHRTDSQLMGPRVCMTIDKWNALHARGLDIGPDGRTESPEKHLGMLSH